MASKELKSEFEVPPHMKVRIVATGNRKLCEEMEHIHEQEIERANAEDRTELDWSNTLEMLLRRVYAATDQIKKQAYRMGSVGLNFSFPSFSL